VGVVWVALVPVQVKPLQFHSYVPPPDAVKVIALPAQTLDALRLIVGAAGNACTLAVTVAAFADWQVVLPDVTREYTDTDLVPVAAPLTVYVPLPVPLCVPAGLPLQVYVAPVTGDVTRNTTFVFWHTVAADTRVTAGTGFIVTGTGTGTLSPAAEVVTA
jgi:hypothetical protein